MTAKNHFSSPNDRHGLYWFRHDLRIDDMPALHTLAQQVDRLTCVFVWDTRWLQQTHFGTYPLGQHRQQFLKQSLDDLSAQLKQYGQTLHIIEGQPLDVLVPFIAQHQITHIAYGLHPGWYERQDAQKLKAALPHLQFTCMHNNSLFDEASLPMPVRALPDTFTPFRKKVEYHCRPIRPAPVASTLPPPGVTDSLSEHRFTSDTVANDFTGGSSAGARQLHYYLFGSGHITGYKETRNGLDGWEYSSKLSPWLANGTLSVRRVADELARFERERVSNDSTYWLYFELLWREFFYWSAFKWGTEWFSFTGVRGIRPKTDFNAEVFTRWCAGRTGYATVDACMRQLNQTGFMSNRGRQWVASCLVHELGQDWRYGAAYFEQQLIDYDVASNYGNWQYLAGVGADPRGHRQFNLDKQANMYDLNGEFRARWLSGE